MTSELMSQDDLAAVKRCKESYDQMREELSKVIIGQDKVIERTLVTVLAGGHGLLVGLPGLAKTKLVETLGVVLGLDTRRVQFTPDPAEPAIPSPHFPPYCAA